MPGDLSAVARELLDAHGTFTRASLPDLSAAAERAVLAAGQLRLEVRRIQARGGDPTVAVDAVRLATERLETERLEGVARDVLALADGLGGRCPDCVRAAREGRSWGCVVHVAEDVL